MLERNAESSMKAAKGVKMELDDCAFPLLNSVYSTPDLTEAFRDANIALLVGARPRTKDMNRSDLLNANAQIFIQQGRAINEVADRNVKVLVVGNPANTNAYIARKCAPDINPKNFTAMMRLDHNRSLTQLAQKTDCRVTDIEKFCVWGNHGNTMFPDVTNTLICGKQADTLFDQQWYLDYFVPTVATRGSAIIEARGHSSAASAANAAIDHIRDWCLGSGDKWQTMAVPSNGEYGIPEGLCFGMPVTCNNGDYEVVKSLELTEFQKEFIKKNVEALEAEKKVVDEIIANS